MFNVKMQKVKFEPINGRSYNLYSMSDKSADKRRYPYRSALRPFSLITAGLQNTVLSGSQVYLAFLVGFRVCPAVCCKASR